YRIVPLADVAARTKTMPKEFLTPDGSDATADFYAYARPLLGSGFPNVHRIRAPKVAKILKGG
ncbi:MAG: 6-phosphofructokinase, partial [Spirochaetes bacterium]|nr:6-phosphofructokinase [Spirochaetota bacterium]